MGRRLKASDGTKATRHKASEVVVRNIAHPKVWATAIKLAGGDKARVTVETYSRVSVLMP
jgi:hypothetical protein